MVLRLREVGLPVPLGDDLLALARQVAGTLGLRAGVVRDLRVVRRGLDARKKDRIRRVYTVEFTVPSEDEVLRRNRGNQRLAQVEPGAGPTVNGAPASGAHASAASASGVHAQVEPGAGQTANGAAARRAASERGQEATLAPGSSHRTVVVGMGPAGLFAASALARAGVTVTLIERGRPVEARVRDVERLWSGGGLDPENNPQFGEGGAGTFSDGKLTTRIGDPAVRRVLETFVSLGAPEDILVDARPHLGTDRLRGIVRRFRESLLEAGVEIRFETRLTDLVLSASGGVAAALVTSGDGRSEELPCDSLVLAPGHSARDTYAMLQARGVHMAAKPFAMGLRVEHPASLIHRIQYGPRAPSPLPPAEYALSWNDRESGRGVYSFCMCPGGAVVLASSEPCGVVTNGMSGSRRDGDRSNAALVVSVRVADLAGAAGAAGAAHAGAAHAGTAGAAGAAHAGAAHAGAAGAAHACAAGAAGAASAAGAAGPSGPDGSSGPGGLAGANGVDPLAGVHFQRRWEQAAFHAGGGDYHVPAQNLLAFLGTGDGAVASTCRPGVREADLARVLPAFVTSSLCRAIFHFEARMRGFITSEAVLLGVETRTSAPLRITRGEDGQSVSCPGLFPAGEGAGHAGGIVSSAVDGLRAAAHVIARASRHRADRTD